VYCRHQSLYDRALNMITKPKTGSFGINEKSYIPRHVGLLAGTIQ